VQFNPQVSHTFDNATNPEPQSLMHVLLLKLKSPVHVRQFAAVVSHVAHVESHAIHVDPLV
jgi:hypothetical protein